jgi:hypothetical protein
MVTKEVIQRVPGDFIQLAERVALNAAAPGGKRRLSNMGVVESVRQSVRQSMRESARRYNRREDNETMIE